MTHITMRLTAAIIEIFFVTFSLNIVQKEKYRVMDFFCCVGLYIPLYFLLEDVDWRIYIIKNVYMKFALKK